MLKMCVGVCLCFIMMLAVGCGDDADPTSPGGADNSPPSITGPETVNGSVGSPVTFDVVATDPDGDRISLVASAVVSVGEWRLGIRAGEVGVDSASGTVTFTPNANDTPQRTLVITAEDPSGEKSSIDVLVLVSTGAPRGAESRE